MFTVTFQGAPYGENEIGHTISRHRSLLAAAKKWRDLGWRNYAVVDGSGKFVDSEELSSALAYAEYKVSPR